MAKVIGPLQSFEARGQVGKALVYTQRRGQSIVRQYQVPANPQSPDQVVVRISFAVCGRVASRVRIGDWNYATQSMSWIEFLTQRLRVGEVWNSVLVRLMLGSERAFYLSTLVLWEALDEAEMMPWETAALASPVSLLPYTRGGTTITPGFHLFLAQRTMAVSGYGPDFDDSVIQPITTAPSIRMAA